MGSRCTIAAALLLSISAKGALAADTARGAALADACAACHSDAQLSTVPRLSALSREQFIQAMTEFRERKRPATIMDRIIRAYTPAEVELMADFFTSGGKR